MADLKISTYYVREKIIRNEVNTPEFSLLKSIFSVHQKRPPFVKTPSYSHFKRISKYSKLHNEDETTKHRDRNVSRKFRRK